MGSERCTCPIFKPHDDPYYHCDYCDDQMERAAEAREHREREDELDDAFHQLCDALNG